ncbi:MAG: ABC transporter permease [Anaerolineae bacterium]
MGFKLPSTDAADRRIIIDADSRPPLFDFKTLWEHRELLIFMIWREWSVRYKQTALGIGWVIVQPLATTVIFSVVFGLFARIETAIPYPVFFLAGFVPYRLFADSLGGASNSLTNNAHLVNKVYFPRIIMPLTAIITTLSDFLVALGVLLVTMLIYGLNPFTVNILALPLFVLLALLTSTAMGLWFSALNVRYRDVAQLMPFVVQVWLYASPVIYPIATVKETLPASLFTLYQLNPMVSVIEGFRWALVGGDAPALSLIAINFLTALVVLIAGLAFFNRMERTFGDVI